MLAGVGVCVGLTLAAVAAPMIAALLYGIRAIDPLIFLAVPLILLVVSFAASYIPARRAAKVMAQLNRVREEARDTHTIPADMTLTDFRQMFDSFKASLHLAQSYHGGPYDGPLTLFSALDSVQMVRQNINIKEYWDLHSDPSLGWDRWVKHGLEIYPTPGNHYTMMRGHNVQILAEQLRACIGRCLKSESIEISAT
ncbi:MAG: hypothetical protein WAN65_04570 [Candidatus Sulfotelmatobacter sp.]